MHDSLVTVRFVAKVDVSKYYFLAVEVGCILPRLCVVAEVGRSINMVRFNGFVIHQIGVNGVVLFEFRRKRNESIGAGL